MRLKFLGVCIWLACMSATQGVTLEELQTTIDALRKQIIQRQVFIEERARTDGDSGVKRVRVNKVNSRPYHSATVTEDSFLGAHDHAHARYTIGFSEFTAVMNGIEFRVPHTDIYMKRPHITKTDFMEAQFVPRPPVPDSVKSLTTVAEQVEEMKMYFKAWKLGDKDLRDHRKYFKPFLCYLEAWWENDNSKSEALEQERARFSVYSGAPNKNEDVYFLPRTFLNADGKSEFAQWKYRVMCHRMARDYGNNDMPTLDQFKVVDDLATRMALDLTLEEYENSPAARFELNPANPNAEWSDSLTGYNFIDEMMGNIPGLNNYPATFSDTECGNVVKHPVKDEPLNTARYHRLYRTDKLRMRAFADRNLYFARTTHEEVANVTSNTCTCDDTALCTEVTQRWSFAMPMEIIFTTPLTLWNPYNVELKGSSTSKNGKTVTENGRNGGFDTATAFSGSNLDVYYRTPAEFFVDQSIKVGVIGSDGLVHNVSASGHHIILPEIEGVGKIRQRFPIAGIHGEGSHAWKVYESLKIMLMNPFKHTDKFYDNWNPTIDGSNDGAPIDPLTSGASSTLQMTLSGPNGHQHDVTISATDVDSLIDGDSVTVTTATSHHHNHELLLEYHGSADTPWIEIVTCSGANHCSDGHKNHLIPVTTA